MTSSPLQPSALQKHLFDFDIDNYLNPICPRQRFYLLPRFISHWFGYRAPGQKPQPRLPNLGAWISSLIGGFIGIAIITNVYSHLPLLGDHQAPIAIASFGAAAILEYNTIESPLSQPRNLILGHFLSALIGVSTTKGFQRLPYEKFEELRWLAGSLSVGVASLVMAMTKTVHPPAGATALLAATSIEITVLGWWLLPLVLLASSLMCTSAMLVNNLTRRWPLYWWTPVDLSKKQSDIVHKGDVEKQTGTGSDPGRTASESGSLAKGESRHVEGNDARSESEATMGEHHEQSQRRWSTGEEDEITITADKIILPDWWTGSDWDREVLEILKDTLKRRSSGRVA